MSADAIATIIGRFGTSFDLKDWPALEELLAEQVALDYADLRGQVETVARSLFVEQRRRALAPLTTQHLLANLEIEVDGDTASCRAAGVIHRRLGDRFFDSHVVYEFGLALQAGRFRIASIAQRVLWSEGDPSIHPGARQPGAAPR